ncbi:MAG: hypothetical protein HY956_09480 [Deltaproteobacteria bacterium]|nr:hypothetical protein [Deltaproteobacteria bacterium]
MKRLILASMGVFLVAFAFDASAAPKALTDGELDAIAAGGAIIGNGASASIHTSGAVEMSGYAGADAAALNFTNAAESMVANGVNITGSSFLLGQSNNIEQDEQAYVGYWTHNDTHESSSSRNSEVFHSSAGVEPASLNIAINGVTIEDGFTFTLDSASLDANYGRGAAAAGDYPNATLDNVGTAYADKGAACVTGAGASCSAALNTDYESETSYETHSTTSELQNAYATYITGDDSELDVETDNTVNLSGNAMQGLAALNVVNAASSVVANGVNIAWGTGGYSLYTSQQNTINQYR